MQFFTKEIYEKMQVGGYLVYPDSKEDLDELLERYRSKGRDYETLERGNFLAMKPYLLKYLPASLKSSVYDESITHYKIPDDIILSRINEWDELVRNYKKHLNSIKNMLPKSMLELCTEFSFHDAEILSVHKSNNDVNLELDCHGCCGYQGNCLLTFKSVKLLEIPDDCSEHWWLYDEVHLSDRGNFDVQVLLDTDDAFLTLHEFRVIADDAHVEVIKSP